MEIKEIIGLDVGLKRIGIARASAAARLAQPLATVPTESALDKISEIAKEASIEAIVVGLPRSLDGNDTEQTKWVRGWVESAKTRIAAPFFWQDEALSSHHAQVSGAKYKSADVDSLAAAIILRDFLETSEDQRVAA